MWGVRSFFVHSLCAVAETRLLAKGVGISEYRVFSQEGAMLFMAVLRDRNNVIDIRRCRRRLVDDLRLYEEIRSRSYRSTVQGCCLGHLASDADLQ